MGAALRRFIVRQAILLMLMLLALVLSPTPVVPKPTPAPVKADRAAALKPFTMPLPTPARVITESYQAFPSEPAFTLPVQAMRVEEQKKPVVAAAAVPKPAKRENDICRGKGRSYYNNGRSWRCNR
jgi:hypothetical protein